MNRIYSATYSNVPVYEYNVAGNHVMRRRSDHWINATHILKVADFDKPARTRILEREVQKGTHEKVQGGYGKYQGTWVPLESGRLLAEKNGCLEKLRPIFDFIPGDRSPPPAPKHATATAARPKASRPSAAAARRVTGINQAPKAATRNKGLTPSLPVPNRSQMSDVSFDTYSNQFNDDDMADQATLTSESEDDIDNSRQYDGGSRKRKRGGDQPHTMTRDDQQHLMWSDELLDYFMLQRSDDMPPTTAPEPPSNASLTRAVDEKGRTALHWAAATGSVGLVQDFIHRGASIDALTSDGMTPLIHAVTFTNNWSKQTMNRLMQYLYTTVGQRDCNGSTAIHHIAASTVAKSKYPTARYYLESILDVLKQHYESQQISMLLDQRDVNGNTAILLAAKHGARKCVRVLSAHGASVEIPNQAGETAEHFIKELNERRRDRVRQGSSSPVAAPEGGLSRTFATLGSQPLASSQPKSQQYSSEAASLLASQLPTLIAARTEALATALEAELAEREAEAREGERLREQRKQELAMLRKEIASLSAKDEGDGVDDAQRAELDQLTAESLRLMEAEQQLDLQQLLREASSAGGVEQPGEGTGTSVQEKVEVARELQRLQRRRESLMEEVVSAQGLAGHGGERQEAYKRLITGALGVRAEDLETMLPDILEELEEAKAERMGGGTRATGDGEGSMREGMAPINTMRGGPGMLYRGGAPATSESVSVMG